MRRTTIGNAKTLKLIRNVVIYCWGRAKLIDIQLVILMNGLKNIVLE